MANPTQKTRELITALRELANTSKAASNNLEYLEKKALALGNLRFSKDMASDIQNTIAGIKEFTQLLRDMGAESKEIQKVQVALASLAQTKAAGSYGRQAGALQRDIKSITSQIQQLKNLADGYKVAMEDIYKLYGGGSVKKGQTALPLSKPQMVDARVAGIRAIGDDAGADKMQADYIKLRQLSAARKRITEVELREAEKLLTARKDEADEFKRLAEAANLTAKKGGGRGQSIDAPTAQGGSKRVIADEKFLSNLNMSATATENFRKKLSDLKLTNAEVVSSYKDLNTGLQHIKMVATDAEGGVSKFTAVVDKSGNVINSTQNRYRSFASAIARDVVEVVKWSVAIGAVYGPMRKLQELMEEAKAIQADLVDVQISLGESTVNLQGIFESSVDIANETSSAVQGVIEGYVAAVAAAGSVAGESQRLATTQLLVRDSMIFSKLAGVEQKEALDTLVGALRQADLELTDGMQLMDSWVAVSRNANVSINQLASTFAIVGAGAEDVGLSYSQLNALSATMAETTKLSADEVGNAIRGIIATLQTDKAASEFAKYGIATKTATGELRNMMDILRELSVLQEAGVLDPKAMGALTQAGGGGARRGAQLSALVSNMSRVMEIVSVSENASGDATQALQLKMNTLESTIQRLNNAFSGLAQSLGMEGGLVGAMTKIAEIAAKIISAFTEVSSVLKGAGPILAAVGIGRMFAGTDAGKGMLAQKIPGFLSNLLVPSATTQLRTGERLTGIQAGRESVGGFAPLTNALVNALQRSGLGYTKTESGRYQEQTFGGLFERIGAFLQRDIMRGMKVGSFMVPGLLMATSLGKEDTGERLGAQAIGTGVGALASALTGMPEWVTVGATIATAFYDKMLTFDEDIVKEWVVAREEAQKEPETEEEAQARLQDRVKKSMSWGETFGVSWRKLYMNAGISIGGMWRNAGQPAGKTPAAGLPQISQSEALVGQYLRGKLDPETTALVEQLLNSYLITAAKEGLSTTKAENVRITNIEGVTALAAQASEELMAEALEELKTGATGAVGRYIDAKQAATQYATAAGTLISAQQMTPGQQPMAPGQAIDFVTRLDADQRELLSTYTEQIVGGEAAMEKLREQIESSPNATQDQIKQWTEEMQEYEASINDARAALPALVEGLQRATLVSSAQEKLKPIIDIPDGLTSDQRADVLESAEALWREYMELSGLSDAEIDAFIKAQQDQLIRANDEIFGITTKVPQEFISSAAEKMGLGAAGAESKFGFMDLREDYSMSSFQSQLMPRYMQVLGAFQRNFSQFGWKPEEENTGFILEDGFTTMDVDLRLLQLAMQDLIDINREKGLEGIYNLPEGATFMIPMTGFQMDRSTRYGMETAGGGYYPNDIFSEQEPGTLGTGTGITDKEEQLSTMTRDELLSAAESFRRVGEQREERLETEEEVPPWFRPAYSEESFNKQSPYILEMQRQLLLPRPGVTTREPGPVESVVKSTATSVGDAVRGAFSQLKLFRRQDLNFSEGIMPSKPSETTQLQQQANPSPIALNLSMDSTTQLVVDGRTLATIIKPYLYEDLLRYSASTPVVNRSVI